MYIVRNDERGTCDVHFKFKDNLGTWYSRCKRGFTTEEAARKYAAEYIAARKAEPAEDQPLPSSATARDGATHAHRPQ